MKAGDNFKMVIIVDDELPTGLKANTVGVLSLTLGNKIQGLVGKDLKDTSGKTHIGLTGTPLPVLKCQPEQLQEIYDKAYDLRDKLLLVDVTNIAQITKSYPEYEQKLSETSSEDLKLLGLALAGDKQLITKLTSSLGLLR